MRERITFVHKPEDAIDPASIGVYTTTLSFSGLKAVREDRITFTLPELPRQLSSDLSHIGQLYLRYVTPSSYDSVPPFNSRLSPGLHVHYTTKRNAEKASQDDTLCRLIDTIFNLRDKSLCKTPEVISFTSLPSQKSPHGIGYEYYLPESQISSGGGASTIVSYLNSICTSAACRRRVDEGSDATYIDLNFDEASETAIITTLWDSKIWNAAISKSSHGDRVEVGILSNEKALDRDELKMVGFLSELGESKKPSPTMFQFPSRHHNHVANFGTSFIEPTGLHPTLKLSIDNSIPPKNHESCTLNAHLTLPRSIFPDKYQFKDSLFLASKNLTALRHVTVPVDLEAPEYKMSLWGSSLLLELAPPPASSQPWTAEIPLHLRYLLPSESGYQSTSLPSPVLFWTCEAEEDINFAINPFDRVNLGYDNLFDPNTVFYHLSPETSRDLYSSVRVPVLRSVYNEQIEIGTTVVILLGFGWVLWKLWLVWANHGYGRVEPVKVATKEE